MVRAENRERVNSEFRLYYYSTVVVGVLSFYRLTLPPPRAAATS